MTRRSPFIFPVSTAPFAAVAEEAAPAYAFDTTTNQTTT
jgi:hypothetical protein